MNTVVRRWAAIPDGLRIRIARSMVALSAALGIFSILAYMSQGEAGYFLIDGRLVADWVFHNVVLGSFLTSLLVWIAIPAQPRNGALWALAWSSLFQGVNAGSQAWVLLASDAAGIEGRAEAVPLSELPLSVGIPLQLASWSWIPGLVLMLTLVLLLLPDGKLLSRRWRPVAWLSVGSIVALSGAFFWVARPRDEMISLDAYEPAWLGPLFLPVLVSVVACTAGLVVRYRRSTGEQRVRLRWIVWGGALLGISTLSFPTNIESDGGIDLYAWAVLAAGAAFLGALFVAITKYRLYDIDIVVSRTVAVTLLVGIIGGLYVAVVYGFGSLVGSGDRISTEVQIIATVVVAIAFQPARRRAQAWANRVVYGQRATPYEVLATFSHGAADESNNELMQQIPSLIVDGTVASEATIWLAAGDVFRVAGSSTATNRTLAVGSEFVDPEADFGVPIYHDGELLGGVSLVLEHGEELSPPERDLVEQLAAGLGLAMRNARLTSQLRSQVAELKASRERILAAADEARRDLERDLDSGPQQQLVALKVKLGPIRVQAERAAAPKTAEVVAQLEGQAGEAIQAVRDFAAGIYPPLLEAEGLVVALGHQSQKAALAISIEAERVGRYPQDIEAAVYFTVLEALQNSAKYSGASSASVKLVGRNGELAFEVQDNGRGFDPRAVSSGAGLTGMTDRIDTAGGSLEIDSAPGFGTAVRGSVPITLDAAETSRLEMEPV